MCYRNKEKSIVIKNWKKATELDKQLKDELFSVGFYQKEKKTFQDSENSSLI